MSPAQSKYSPKLVVPVLGRPSTITGRPSPVGIFPGAGEDASEPPKRDDVDDAFPAPSDRPAIVSGAPRNTWTYRHAVVAAIAKTPTTTASGEGDGGGGRRGARGGFAPCDDVVVAIIVARASRCDG